MKEHLRKNEADISELLIEYWRLRDQTGTYTRLEFACLDKLTSGPEVYMETLADKLGMDLS